MDQVVKATTTGGGTAGKNFHKPCAFDSEGVSRETCESTTKVGIRNRQGCCGNGRFKPCQSPWRLCIACVSHGGTPKVVVDFESGLCAFHKDHGTGVESPKPNLTNLSLPHRNKYDVEVLPPEKEEELTSEEGLIILGRVRLAMSKAAYISVPPDKIRAMPGQPRVYFNPERMTSLEESIESSGQWMPGIIRPVVPDAEGCTYELIDGERRLRAIRNRKIPHYRAMLVEIDDVAAPFVVSVIANFNRETHTTLELVDSIVKMHDKLHLKMAEIAKLVGLKNAVEVGNYYAMRRLVPKVRDMLDPGMTKGRLLPRGAAIAISKMPIMKQVELAERVMAGELGTHTIHAEVARILQVSGVPMRKRYVDPGDHRKAVERKIELLSRAAQDLQSLLGNQEVQRAMQEWPTGRLIGLRATVETSKSDVANCWSCMDTAVEKKSR